MTFRLNFSCQVLLLLLVTILFLIIPSIEGLGQGHGEVCDAIQRCNPRAFLSCQNGVCDCLNKNDMTYNPIAKRCLALASRKCKYAIVNPNGDLNANKLFDYADCVPNASCNSEGICVCNNHHVEKPNGTCVEQSWFYEYCESTSECRTNLYLTCINKTCQCDPDSAIDNWDIGFGASKVRIGREDHKCIGLADKPCLGGECTRNAICTKDYMSPGPGICDCKRGMIKSEAGICATVDFDYDAACSNKEKRFCHVNFACIRGKCRCKYSELHQFYDVVKEMCRSFAWGPCDLNGTLSQCLDNALCVNNNLTGLPQCECSRGFVENSEGKCELAHGADCHPSDASMKCDQMAPLICRDGKCACEDSLQVYDSATRRCRGLVGALCNEKFPCVRNAVCTQRYESNPLFNGRGQCQCTTVTMQTADRTCSTG